MLNFGLAGCAKSQTETARVAVATNFLITAKKLEAAFEGGSDFEIDIVSGSTGQLYAQIINGAPYDVFLSADAERVTKVMQTGYAADSSYFTYAVGQLVLIGEGDVLERLKSEEFKKLAMGNPVLSPYGAAAKETLAFLKLSVPEDKIVYGQNVGHVYGFTRTGNADLAFAALSQVQDTKDNYWRVPEEYHAPIHQDGVLLKRGAETASAKAFMVFLQSAEARTIIEMSGYEVVAS